MKYELKEGILKSGKGGKGGVVKNRKQAIAIALSEAENVETKTAAKPKKYFSQKLN